MNVYFDIGCHVGYYAFMWTRNPNNMVYAFEPVPELYLKLKEKEAEHRNFKVFNYAICENNGEAFFNVNDNLATCSLKEFSDGYTAFNTIQKIKVETKRLDTFCDEMGINKIHLLKSDAQGSDLEVIKSMGDKIINCNTLLIEAFITDPGDCVYKDEVKKNQVIEYLREKGFSLQNEAIDGNYADLTFGKN
jgi:FkbM family methyltransferase